MYNWQHPQWPNFTYDLGKVQHTIYAYGQDVGLLRGHLEQLPEALRNDAIIDLMVLEALKTSEIEGERFDVDDVRSSIRNQLGVASTPEPVRDPRAQGIAQLMLAVRESYAQSLTTETLFAWHRMIFPGNYQRLEIGQWRTYEDPMQIVSGAYGQEKVHFEAPPSAIVPQEMDRFIAWVNQTMPGNDGVFLPGPVRAAIAHLYFESIHPFADGNGRIGRAICEKMLSQDLRAPIPYSLSTTFHAHRKTYYQELAFASRPDMNITPWIVFFCQMVYEALLSAKENVAFVVQKSQFWKRYGPLLNPRQEKILSRMLKEGPKGFEGGISPQKYMSMTACSKATATRDLAELLVMGCLYQLPGGGRSTRYQINLRVDIS